jgi:hypothetical protein
MMSSVSKRLAVSRSRYDEPTADEARQPVIPYTVHRTSYIVPLDDE